MTFALADPVRLPMRRACVAMNGPAATSHRRSWKRDLTPYLEIDERRSMGQIASVVIPYLGIWAFAAAIRPGPVAAVALGLGATVFLVRMYSLFHDLTHKSLFRSRAANSRWGYLLGFRLF